MKFLRLPRHTINLKYVVTIIYFFDRYEITLASGVIIPISAAEHPVSHECIRRFCEERVDSCCHEAS